MTLFAELPIEVLLIIISGLKVCTSPQDEHWRHENRQAVIPLARTNKLLWKIARPFLYHDLELFFHSTDQVSKGSQKFSSWTLSLVTSLLCRTLYEDPLLISNIYSLEIRGLLALDYGMDIDHSGRGVFRKQVSDVHYSTHEITNLLILCTNVRRLQIRGVLKEHSQHETNKIIISCLKRMSQLEELYLSAGADIATGADFTEGADINATGNLNPSVIHSFLAVTSGKLKILGLGPRRNIPSRTFTDFSGCNNSVANARFQLEVLDLPTAVLPLAAFSPWIRNLRSLTLNEIKLSDQQSNQGLSIGELIMPMAATLRHLHLIISPFFSRPLLSDFNMSHMTALDSLVYEGPWWISSTYTPLDLYQALFSRSYQMIELDLSSSRQSHRVSHRSVVALKEAFKIAHLNSKTPAKLNMTLDISDEDIYDTPRAAQLESGINGLMMDLRNRGAEVTWEVMVPETGDWH
jgi:hypothetical protein